MAQLSPAAVFELELEVLTPLFVLKSGEKYVEGVDYIVDNKRVYLIDWFKVDLPPNIYDLQRAVEYVRSRRGAVKGVEVFEVNSMCGKELYVTAEVPPSSVKGLIRTVYIYSRLAESPDLLKELEAYVEEKIQKGGRPDSFFSDFERRIMQIEVEGRQRPMDLFTLLSVEAVEQRGSRAAYCVEVRHLGQPQPIASFSAIGLAPGSRLRYRVVVRGDAHVRKFVDQYGLLGLEKWVEKFSRDLAEFERGRKIQVPDCKGFPLRLGFGAGRRWKTVLNLLSQSALSRLTSYMSRGKLWGDTTVKIVDGKPVGWVCAHVRRL